MRIIFMGTPDFAVEGLEAIQEAGHEILLVISQEDKAKGRKAIIEKTPVKLAAERLGLPVHSTKRLRADRDCIDKMKSLKPDCIVVAAFGQILPKEVLDIPKLGAVNIHASLLPKYRGASPIQEAVLSGDKESGITTMFMAEGLDTGDILLQDKVALDPEETAESLFQKLAKLSRRTIVKTLESLQKGELKGIPQKEEEASHTGIIKKKDGFINWNRGAAEIERMVRGYIPWPNAVSLLPSGKSFKIWKAAVFSQKADSTLEKNASSALFSSLGRIKREDIERFLNENMQESYLPLGNAGEFFCSSDKKRLFVSTGDAVLEILELQVEGKKRMSAGDFLRGYIVK